MPRLTVGSSDIVTEGTLDLHLPAQGPWLLAWLRPRGRAKDGGIASGLAATICRARCYIGCGNDGHRPRPGVDAAGTARRRGTTVVVVLAEGVKKEKSKGKSQKSKIGKGIAAVDGLPLTPTTNNKRRTTNNEQRTTNNQQLHCAFSASTSRSLDSASLNSDFA